jgi:hypothetical protein
MHVIKIYPVLPRLTLINLQVHLQDLQVRVRRRFLLLDLLIFGLKQKFLIVSKNSVAINIDLSLQPRQKLLAFILDRFLSLRIRYFEAYLSFLSDIVQILFI